MSWRAIRQRAEADDEQGHEAVRRIVGGQSESPEADRQLARTSFEKAADNSLQPHDKPRGESQ